LQAVTFFKGSLHGMLFTLNRDTFNRGNLRAVNLNGEYGAGLNGFTIHMHGTRTALTGIAANMGSGKHQVLTQQLRQSGVSRTGHLPILSIYDQIHGF
jgi:hypothetical protein